MGKQKEGILSSYTPVRLLTNDCQHRKHEHGQRQSLSTYWGHYRHPFLQLPPCTCAVVPSRPTGIRHSWLQRDKLG